MSEVFQRLIRLGERLLELQRSRYVLWFDLWAVGFSTGALLGRWVSIWLAIGVALAALLSLALHFTRKRLRRSPIISAKDDFKYVARRYKRSPRKDGDSETLRIFYDLDANANFGAMDAAPEEQGDADHDSRPSAFEYASVAADDKSALLPETRFTDLEVKDAKGNALDPQTCLVAGKSYDVSVTIRCKRLGLTASRDDQPGFKEPSPGQEARLWLVVSDESFLDDDTTKAAFDIPQRCAKLKLPVAGDSDTAVLRFTPSKLADYPAGWRGRLGIRIFHNLNLVDHLELCPWVGATATDTPSDQRRGLDVAFPRKEAKPMEVIDPKAAQRELNISVVGNEAQGYRFTFTVNQSDLPPLTMTRKMPLAVLTNYISRFRMVMVKATLCSAKTSELRKRDCEDILQELAAIGAAIISDLFDFQKATGDGFVIGQILRNWVLPETKIIQVALSDSLEDFVFPWQVLITTAGTGAVTPAIFWGYNFVIEQKVCRDGARVSAAQQNAPRPIMVNYGRWSSFANENTHLAGLKDILASAKPPATLAPIIDGEKAFLESLRQGGGDVLYLFAHMQAAAPVSAGGLEFLEKLRVQLGRMQDAMGSDPENADGIETLTKISKAADASSNDCTLMLSKANISLGRLEADGIDDDPIRLTQNPIVILNACESAQLWPGMRSSFAGFFLARGARAVVGTEAMIPAVVANVFGLRLLKALLVEGVPIGEAVRRARIELLASNNPLGLSYTIYGAADASVASDENGDRHDCCH